MLQPTSLCQVSSTLSLQKKQSKAKACIELCPRCLSKVVNQVSHTVLCIRCKKEENEPTFKVMLKSCQVDHEKQLCL